MQFRFYITDTYAGRPIGTDNEKLARDYAQSEDFFVVDTLTGQWLNVAGDYDVEPAQDISSEGE